MLAFERRPRRVDGAGEFSIFRTIVLPVIAPILVTLGAFAFLSAWNDFMWPLVVLSDERLYTLPDSTRAAASP